MAKKKTAASGDQETLSAPAPTAGRGGPRGPRGIKLAVPVDIQKKISDLSEIYPKLKDAPARYLAILEPGLGLAYQTAFDQLLESLEAERTAKVNALRGASSPLASVAPDLNDPDYVALDDSEAQ